MFYHRRQPLYIPVCDYTNVISHSTLLVIALLIQMMMKYLIVLCCAMAAVLAEEKYTSKYDNMDLQEVLKNDRLLKNYIDCLLDKGKCTPDGKELKDNMQDAMETGCKKCTEAQENGAATVIAFLIEHKPEMWRELTAKYDPEGTWRKKYEERAKAKGIKIPE